ncbi:MAG: hypothetical protein EOO43_06125 [Flavobacterium sp.]|nr:MAG: hypothetical protein EOO43_06125 [Flavobacterium sp.]
MYDDCAYTTNIKQSTDSLELILDVTKYVNYKNRCAAVPRYPDNSLSLVDVESSLWGIDKLSSECDMFKHPFCKKTGCILTSDSRIPTNAPPYLCERGGYGSDAVVTTNMRMPTNPGFNIPVASPTNVNSFYSISGNRN